MRQLRNGKGTHSLLDSFEGNTESADEGRRVDKNRFNRHEAMEMQRKYLQNQRDLFNVEREKRTEKSFLMATTQVACLGAGLYCVTKKEWGEAMSLLGTAIFIEAFTILRCDSVGAASSIGSIGLSGLGVSVEAGLARLGSGLAEWQQPVSISHDLSRAPQKQTR